MASKKEALFLRLEPALIGNLKKLSEKDGLSLNAYCSSALERSISRDIGIVSSRYDSVVRDAKDFFGDHLRAVILFGSKARGDSTSESDTDFLFVVDNEVRIQRATYTNFENSKTLADEVSIHIVNLPLSYEALSGLWCEIALEGIMLFDKNLNVSGFLLEIRRMILEGVYLARYSHGHRYWTYDSAKEAA